MSALEDSVTILPAKRAQVSHDERNPPTQGEPKPSPPPRRISPASLFGKKPPQRAWIVRDWIPCGVVTGLYGDGGLGKSLSAQQLQTGAALGTTWLGLPVEQVASLGVYCEDDEDELWRRQDDINQSYGVEDGGRLASLEWMPRLGEDNILMTFNSKGVGELTKFHEHVTTAALDLKARLVSIDCAPQASWRDPAGGSPAQVRGSARLLASVARLSATAGAKRTQQSCGVWD